MKALVTGGGGFLGKAVVMQLKEAGHTVRSFSRGSYPELEAAGVECARGDIANADDVKRAAEGCDIVFHVAAKPGIWGPYADYLEANVTGTENVLEACRALGITKLVHTSSPSAVFNGQDMENVDEKQPYPTEFHGHYSQTKAMAERMVLAANSPTLSTVALRPHLIWGIGDNHVLPRLLARARAGKLRFIDGGMKKVDTTYIDNAASSHLCAAAKLAPDAACAGKAYFISNGEPRATKEIVNALLATYGVPAVEKSLPLGVAKVAAFFAEMAWSGFGLEGEPPLTRFLAGELATAHWFDISAAKRDLGWEPTVTIAEGLERMRKHNQASK